MQPAKFSHITHDTGFRYKLKTLCGRYLDGMNLSAIYTEGYEPTAWKRAPLCPKCAALKIIADTSTPR